MRLIICRSKPTESMEIALAGNYLHTSATEIKKITPHHPSTKIPKIHDNNKFVLRYYYKNSPAINKLPRTGYAQQNPTTSLTQH